MPASIWRRCPHQSAISSVSPAGQYCSFAPNGAVTSVERVATSDYWQCYAGWSEWFGIGWTSRKGKRTLKVTDFELERFFAQWEFNVPYLLCAADAETWSVAEVLGDDGIQRWQELRLGYTETVDG